MVSIWAEGLGGHRVRSIVMTTRKCSDPDDLLGEVARIRCSGRQAIARRLRDDEARWSGLRLWAVAVPRYDASGWSAAITGVVDLARVPEVALEDALGTAAPARIRAIASPLLARDVRQHVTRAISTTAGLREASLDGVAWLYSAIDRAGGGGWRAITWTRGLHRQEAAR